MQKLLRENIYTDKAPKGRGPFPQAVKAGQFLFLSGWGPLDTATNAPIKADFEAQVRKTFENISAIAEKAGMSLENAVRFTVFLTDLANVPRFNEIYTEYFPDEDRRPARTLVQVVLRGIEVEIEATLMEGQ